MGAKEKQTQGFEGPPAYENWIAAENDEPSQGAFEYPLFTDARITGKIIQGYGPYQFLNPIPVDDRPGLVQPAIILRFELHVKFPDPDMTETNMDRYHGGSLVDEIAALSSLALGIRLKAGGMTRQFEQESDPRGQPTAWESKPTPVVLIGSPTLILPTIVGSHSLNDLDSLTVFPKLSPSEAIAVVRAARLYQDALWIVESEPSLSWVMLVSAVETAANHWRTAKDPPLERLKSSKPKLVELLEATGIEGLSAQVADHIAESLGSTRKFVDFITTFLSPPPLVRPNNEEAQHSWNPKEIRKTMRLIYDYRSKALHDGRPFPAPMCQPPYRDESSGALTEKPICLAMSTMGGTWQTKDTPMLLYTFEYIVRHALLKWWKSMADV